MIIEVPATGQSPEIFLSPVSKVFFQAHRHQYKGEASTIFSDSKQ